MWCYITHYSKPFMVFLRLSGDSFFKTGSNVTRFGKLSLCEPPVWQTCYPELFNKGWFDQTETRA